MSQHTSNNTWANIKQTRTVIGNIAVMPLTVATPMRTVNNMSQKSTTHPWPDIMAAARAAMYCGVSVEAINKARREKLLVPAGQRGGKGAFTYTKVELDRWMRGEDRAS